MPPHARVMSPATNVAAWNDLTALNHDKAWKVLCRMEREHLLVLLSRALRFVPPGKPQRDLQRSRGGKQTFEAKLDLLFDRRIEGAAGGDSAEVVAAYDLCSTCFVRSTGSRETTSSSSPTRGGTWQFNINWARVLPPYISCLATAVFERRADALIEEFVDPWQRGAIRDWSGA